MGDRIVVAGTTANLPDGTVPVEAGEQADLIFTEIVGHIEALGGKAEHVVRVRMFVTDIAYADPVSAAFSRHMKIARPTGTLVAISALYRAEWKVEIEAEAVVPSIV